MGGMRTLRIAAVSSTLMIMSRLALTVVGFALAVELASPANAAASPQGGAVWNWDSRCSSPKKIRIEAILDGKRIYESKFSICHLFKYSQPVKPQRTLVFRITAPHKSLFGEPAKEPLEGDVWEAGRDPDAIVLGVSFSGPQQIWCNSLHILYPNKASKTILARGLIIRTSPDLHGASIG
jgi:hypothetical protein